MLFLRKILLIAIMVMFAINNKLEAALSPVAESFTPKEELQHAIIARNIRIMCMKRRISSETVITNISQHADRIFTELESQIDDEQWTIVVFSEHFWGNADHILTSAEVTQIVATCNEITSRHKKVVIHINFLHQFKKSTTNEASCGWLNSGHIAEPNGRVCSGQDESAFALVSPEVDSRVANYSLVIWNNRPIAIYRKSTYHNEANALVLCYLHKHAYEFGDFKTHSLITADGDHKDVASLFSGDTPLIITRICADINDRFLPNIPKEDNSILIISANFKRVSGNFCKKENFSRNTFIIVCDTAFGVSLLRVEDESLTKKSLPIREPDFQNDLFHCYCKMMDDVLKFVNVEDCVGAIAEYDGNEEYIVGDEDNVDDASCDSGCCCMCLFYSKN